jgi:hypothetical protein
MVTAHMAPFLFMVVDLWNNLLVQLLLEIIAERRQQCTTLRRPTLRLSYNFEIPWPPAD